MTTTKSRNIPIAPQDSTSSREEAVLHHDVVRADYKDFIFFSRLVEGMQKKQDATHDIALRYQNQALIDHIIHTRRDLSSKNNHNHPPQPQWMPAPSSLRSSAQNKNDQPQTQHSHHADLVSEAIDIVNDDLMFYNEGWDEEELMFEMDT
jgi:hypothetical protein